MHHAVDSRLCACIAGHHFLHNLQTFKVYKKLRVERMNARLEGMRKKRAEEEAAAEKDKA